MSSIETSSVICSFVSLLIAVIIGCFQIKQADRMRHFEERQDIRDERRRTDDVESVVRAFMIQHSTDLKLLPLCVMAVSYDELRYYNRALYRDFCCQTEEVQNAILKRAKLSLQVMHDSNLFSKCIDAVNDAQKNCCKNMFDLFYENGKYVERAIIRYGQQSIPQHVIAYTPPCQSIQTAMFSKGKSLYTECLTDVLLELRGDRCDFQNANISMQNTLRTVYKCEQGKEINTCQYACEAARYIAMYFSKQHGDDDDSRYLGCPEDFDEQQMTMEDLFLQTLFNIWQYLLVDEVKEERKS